jgi:type III secretory pathway lipoprotein EscJ
VPRLLVAITLALALAACRDDAFAPPAEAHARADGRLGETLAAHLAELPGVEAASVVVRTPRTDPLAPATGAPAAPSASVIQTLEAGADAEAVTAAATAAVTAAVPALDAAAVTVTASEPPAAAAAAMTKVGPFEVSERSRGPLLAALATALVAIAALASWVVWIYGRRGIRPQ